MRGQVRTSGPVPVNPMPDHYDAPDLFLREYDDALCLPRQVVVQRGLVLPESFTTVEDHRQRNAVLHNVSLDFVRSPLAGVDPVDLPGRWFHLDNHLLWHFGHAVTEQVSHLWGWQRARAADPGLRALVCSETGELTAWQRDLLAAGGVPPDEVHVATAAVRVETLVGCTPMFSRPAFVHPGMLETYHADQRARSRLGPAPGRGRSEVFIGRRGSKRACRNADELVAEFVAAGFEVIHPEDHPLADQVEYVRRAEVVAGFAGSGMFHVAFTGGPRHVVLVTSESYPAHNEYLMSRAARPPAGPGALRARGAAGGRAGSPARASTPTSPTGPSGRVSSCARCSPRPDRALPLRSGGCGSSFTRACTSRAPRRSSRAGTRRTPITPTSGTRAGAAAGHPATTTWSARC